MVAAMQPDANIRMHAGANQSQSPLVGGRADRTSAQQRPTLARSPGHNCRLVNLCGTIRKYRTLGPAITHTKYAGTRPIRPSPIANPLWSACVANSGNPGNAE